MYDEKLHELDTYYLNNHRKFILIGIIQSISSCSFTIENTKSDKDIDLFSSILKVDELHDIEVDIFNNHDFNDKSHSTLLDYFELCLHVTKDQTDAHIDIIKGIVYGVILQIISALSIIAISFLCGFIFDESVGIIVASVLSTFYIVIGSVLITYREEIINKILK